MRICHWDFLHTSIEGSKDILKDLNLKFYQPKIEEGKTSVDTQDRKNDWESEGDHFIEIPSG